MFYNRDRKIVISTPTKTGSEMLKVMLVKDNQFVYTRPQHSYDWPKKEEWRRILTIRDPYDRLRSMYFWSCRRNYHFAAKFCNKPDGTHATFSEFLKFHSTYEHPTWGWNFSRIADYFGATEFWRLENITDHLKEFVTPSWNVCPHCNVPILPQTNKGIPQKGYDAVWTPEDYAVVKPFVVADCERFGYPLRS